MSREDEYIQNRKNNFNWLIENGFETYPYTFNKTHNSNTLQDNYKGLENEKETTDIASVAGRILTIRSMGKLIFIDLNDTYGKIQLVLREEDVTKKIYELANKLDNGDIIGASGIIFRTKRGELSIKVSSLTFLAKCFLPLPEKFHGLQDSEVKYRKRHLDLMLSKESRDVFITRSKIISTIREVLNSKGFLEVETPILQPLYGGANARPFVTESFVWKRKLYLAISPELYLKRLLVGGFEKIYTIVKNFRNEGVDKSHNPEFTMIEWYEAYYDYNRTMELLEEICETIAIKLTGGTKINYQGQELDFKRPWKKLTMIDALKQFANIDVNSLSDEQLKQLLKENKLQLEEYKRGLAIAEIFEHYCEEKLIGPIHIIDHPKETTPLCKLKRGNSNLIERDEPYLNKKELSNAYSELNDPYLQEQFMNDQVNQGRAKGENHPIDTDFIETLKYGMPPAAGIGIGIDRLVMIFTNSANIRDVIFFPMLKEEDNAEKENKQ
ncbi:MAG: lysine--tRNA ligase [archaeon]